ncbi:MAG TPA: ATP-binding protein [Chloroflexia bacterium]|nr:ATP-binding protein [Chloroflexia bacterium]
MTGHFVFDSAILAVSLFNTILLLWLGLTVLLNAERRTWGVWLAGGGLLLGAGFFVSHSAILGYGLNSVNWRLNVWWYLGWLPVVVLPLAWYTVMLWYSGFWDDPRGRLRRWHRVPWALTILLAGAVLFFVATRLPAYTDLARLAPAALPSIQGLPILAGLYAVYSVLCLGLSLDALRHPGPAARVMGDLARRRARPWMAGTAAVLLVVILLVAVAFATIVLDIGAGPLFLTYGDMTRLIAGFDLAIESLIGLVAILLGQAIVSYEIFTGKTLPRRGLARHWRSAILLAAGYSAAGAAGLIRGFQPTTALLLATLLMTGFYALFSWRSYAERDRYMDLLRPFVASQRLYEDLLAPAAPPAPIDASRPFQALCADLLGARTAYLLALGPLAPLVGPPLAYPAAAAATLPAVPDLPAGLRSHGPLLLPVDPARAGGACWAVPLWSERGLIGVLLLGEKRDGGLYSQEEIEIARASGERLIDTQASAALAGRLMALQRQRLADSGVLDRRARRVLHDDVLPLLHTAMLTLSGGATGAAEELALLADAHRRISDLLHELPPPAPAVSRLGLVAALRQVVEDEWAGAFDGVCWRVDPAAAQAAAQIPPLTAEVLFYAAREAIRNAARYGRAGEGGRALHLQIGVALHEALEITVEDDGVGLGTAPGAPGGSGQGLALHSTLLAVVGGTLAVSSVPDRYTRVVLSLPLAVLS